MLIFNVAKMIVSRDECQLSVDPLNSAKRLRAVHHFSALWLYSLLSLLFSTPSSSLLELEEAKNWAKTILTFVGLVLI